MTTTESQKVAMLEFVPLMSSEERQRDKAMRFGMLYGMGQSKSAVLERLGVDLKGARTGRFSSRKSNLQNMPRRALDYSVDYRDLELRTLAGLSGGGGDVVLQAGSEGTLFDEMASGYALHDSINTLMQGHLADEMQRSFMLGRYAGYYDGPSLPVYKVKRALELR